MAHDDSGLKGLLAFPAVYQAFQDLVGNRRYRAIMANEYIRANPDDRVLDIGCGPAELVGDLPAVRYIGFDMNARYIERARRRYGNRGKFFVGTAGDASAEGMGEFDLVISLGVLHHLDDPEAGNVFRIGHRALRSGGRMITMDPCFCPEQSWAARLIISFDRGHNVRDEAGYLAFARRHFGNVRTTIRHDLIRIPFSGLIIECTK